MLKICVIATMAVVSLAFGGPALAQSMDITQVRAMLAAAFAGADTDFSTIRSSTTKDIGDIVGYDPLPSFSACPLRSPC